MPHRLLRKLAGWAASREKNVKNVAGEVSRAFEERLLVLVAQEAVQPGGGGAHWGPLPGCGVCLRQADTQAQSRPGSQFCALNVDLQPWGLSVR